jgi:hypothetical protein
VPGQAGEQGAEGRVTLVSTGSHCASGSCEDALLQRGWQPAQGGFDEEPDREQQPDADEEQPAEQGRELGKRMPRRDVVLEQRRFAVHLAGGP